MSKKNPAAFPRPGDLDSDTSSQKGMTLRDYFAGQALLGLLSNQAQVNNVAAHFGDTKEAIQFGLSYVAYELADKMLETRDV